MTIWKICIFFKTINFFVCSYGGPRLPRQNLLFHGKTFFSKGLRKIRNPEHSESGGKAKITTESNKLKDGDIRLGRYS